MAEDDDVGIVRVALQAMRDDGMARLLGDHDSLAAVKLDVVDGLVLRLGVETDHGNTVCRFTIHLQPGNSGLPDVQPESVDTVEHSVDAQRYLDVKEILAATGAFPETLAALEAEYERVHTVHSQGIQTIFDDITNQLRRPENLRAVVQAAHATLALQRLDAVAARLAPANDDRSTECSEEEWLSGDEAVVQEARRKRKRVFIESSSSDDDDDDPSLKRARTDDAVVVVDNSRWLPVPEFYRQDDVVRLINTAAVTWISSIGRRCDRVKWLALQLDDSATVEVPLVYYPIYTATGVTEDIWMASAHLLFAVYLRPFGATFARAFVYTALRHTLTRFGTLFQLANEQNVKRLETHVGAILRGPQRSEDEFQTLREHPPMQYLTRNLSARTERMMIPERALSDTAVAFFKA
jgi:hypothetical protein